MPVKFLFWFTLFSLGSLSSHAQGLHQQFQGFVRQEASLEPVAHAQLLLRGKDRTYQTTTSEEGFFQFEQVFPGRYQLSVYHLAFEPQFIPEVLIKTSREEKLKIQLKPRQITLKEINVTATSAPLSAEGLNHTLFTMEETQRYAATFYDPARLMLSHPGVTSGNDQNNQLVIHGQSPNNISWQIEGGEVLSPNHLPNAGTFSDRAAVGGGGVSILSGQLLGNSHFYSGIFPATMGNSVGGAFDIRLRDGSTEQYSHTLHASLLGIDLATEGPFSKKSNSSYLLNYRYSTVGLLSQLGVNFGNEEIHYQDFSFHVNLAETALGSFSFFGLGGLSSNDLIPLEETESWESDRDRQEVNFEAGMGALGINHTLSLGESSSLTNVLTYSARYSNRIGKTFSLLSPSPIEDDETLEEVSQQLLAFKSIFSARISPRLSTTAGFSFNAYQSQLLAAPGKLAPDLRLSPAVSYLMLQPFISLEYSWSPEWLLSPSFRLLYDNQNKRVYPEPGLQLKKVLSSDSYLQLSYGLRSQQTLNQPHLTTALDYQNSSLEPLRSHYSSLGYSKTWPSNTLLKTELFYQYFFNVPVSPASGSFSALNLVEDYALFPLTNTGEGQVYGLDMSLQKYFTNSFYYLASLSLFDASYQGADKEWRNMRFNSQYTASLTAGKEWAKQKDDHLRLISLNIRSLYRAGYWHTPIDETGSFLAGTTLFLNSQAYTQRLPAYATFDVRLSHTKQKENYLRTWALDIQNITNRENISWYYFDQLQQEVVPMYQLGIIPVLAYRLEF